MEALEIITIGRASVDLYGQQIGGRLEDMRSFSKAVGGCPANIAIGAARLGLRAGLITRVGDEAMGRFIREQLDREGVDTKGVRTDKERLTALVLLGVRDDHSFPLIFYRSQCADAALDESDIEEAHIAAAGAIVVTGTHFSLTNTAAAQNKAIDIARRHGRRVVFDIDYRPNLWGLAGHDAGEGRYIASGRVSERLKEILPRCDLIVGTEEEWRIAGGEEDTLAALRAARGLSQAVFVVKRGPMGCAVFDAAIPDSLDKGIAGPGFPVQVYNVLGAGDAFMAGFLRGWLRDEKLETCCRFANASGAFAVSRLLCSVEYPTFAELQALIKNGVKDPILRRDAGLNHLHWATTRDSVSRLDLSGDLCTLAIDHRAQCEAMADAQGASRERIAPFKLLALEAALATAQGRPGFGMLLDGTYGRDALLRAADHPLWMGRPVEKPGSRPLEFEFEGSLAAKLIEWPQHHTVKALCFYHPDDKPEMKARQNRELRRVHEATRALGRELMVEIIAGKNGDLRNGAVARVIAHLYALGIKPDWWKLEMQPDRDTYRSIVDTIKAADPYCRGVVLLGLDAPVDELIAGFPLAASFPLIRGFAIGRTIFARPFQDWLAGRIDDRAAVDRMATSFEHFTTAWRKARAAAQ